MKTTERRVTTITQFILGFLFCFSLTANAEEPLAIIQTILVNGSIKEKPTTSEMEVFRNSRSITVTRSMSLIKNDRVVAYAGTQVGLLYLRNAVETNKTAYLNPPADITIEDDKSIFVRLGKALLSLQGLFDGRTPDGQYAARGTEFLIEVDEDGKSIVRVHTGFVTFEPSNSSNGTLMMFPFQPKVVPASYMPDPPAPSSRILEFEIPSDKKMEIKRQLRVRNSCGKKHKFKIEEPDDQDAIDLSDDRVELKAGEWKTIDVKFQIDGRKLNPGIFQGQFIFACTNCEDDPSCRDDSIPFVLAVNKPGTVIIKPLQELTKADASGKRILKSASVEDVSSTLNWSNEVILAGQPSYTAKGVVPHFTSKERRDQTFRRSRSDAILYQRAGSFETLGNIYSDWGVGAKALEAYYTELKVDRSKQNSAGFLADVGEAHRQVGQLDQAEKILNQAINKDPSWSPALNAIGNVQLDRAKVAHDQSKDQEALGMLEMAEQSFRKASQSAEEIPLAETVVHSNLGETYLAWGDIVQNQDRAEDRYRLAEQEFSASRSEFPQNPFSATGSAKVLNRLGRIEKGTGDTRSANEHFDRSEEILKRTVGANRDFAPAYVALGMVHEERENERAAAEAYKRAIEVRPDDPSPRYSLGKLLEEENKQKAAENLYTYLQLEPSVFKQGEKAAAVRPFVQQQFGTTGENKKEPPPPWTPPPPRQVEVPDVDDDDRDDAIRKIQRVGLVAQIEEKQGCKDIDEVIAQDPSEDTKVPVGSTVKITVAIRGTISVPDVRGRHQEDAVNELTHAGLRVGHISKQPSDKPEGTISSQNPKPNSLLASDCPVDLVVAITPPPIPVPSFINKKEKDARNELLALSFLGDFRLGEITYVDLRDKAGLVIQQHPEAGTMVPKGGGTVINLVVARVPDYDPER